MDSVPVLLILVVVVAIALRSYHFGRRASTDASTLNQELLRLALGDKETVERLIEFERERDPTASRARLVRRAIDRWRRDNR